MRRAASVLAATMLVSGIGCGVQADKYDNTVLSARTLKEQLVATERERDVAKANFAEAQQQLNIARTANGTLQTEVTKLNESFDEQAGNYDDLMRRLRQLEFGPLPAELEEALDHLASAYPDLLSFDAEHGLLRFSSDFSFDSGSAELKVDAEATIATLADILNSQEAAHFEIRLIGHTDNVPVQRPSTLSRHPSNIHLSVHRAISVRGSLVAAGLDPTRIQVAGYGEFRPIVPNGKKGAAQNRRVELVLVPLKPTVGMRELDEPIGIIGIEEPMK